MNTCGNTFWELSNTTLRQHPSNSHVRLRKKIIMFEIRTTALFIFSAIAEILGCYMFFLWLRQGKSILLLAPAAVFLCLFAWLLTLHPTAAGRTYAAYGGVYIATAIMWLWLAEGVMPTRWDILGSFVALLGMVIIIYGSRVQ